MEFRDAVKYLRSELGLTQVELAMGLHVNAITVGRWENGKTFPVRSITTLLLDYARAKGAPQKCLDALAKSIAEAAKSKLDFAGDELYGVEHASLRQLIDDASYAIFVCDMETDEILYLNHKAGAMIGAEGSASGGKCYKCLMHRDTPCEFCHKSELTEDEFKDYDVLRESDGLTYHLQGKLIQWNGRKAHVKCVLSAETPSETLISAARLKTVFDNINGGVSMVIFKDDGTVRLAYANERYYELFGYTKEQFTEELKSTHDIIHPDDIANVTATINKVKETKQGATFRYRVIRRDRSVAYLRCNSSVTTMVGVDGYILVSILTDITESVCIEQQAIVSGKRLDAIMNNMVSAVTAAVAKDDGTFEFLFTNDLYFSMIGYTKEQFFSEVTDLFTLAHPDDADSVRDAVYSLHNIGDYKEILYRAVTRSGNIKWLRVRISIMTFPDVDKPVQLAVYSDVTDIVEAQEKLAAQNKQIAGLLNNTPSGIAIVEADQRNVADTLKTTFYNNRFFIFSGYTRDEYDAQLKTNELAFVHEADVPILAGDTERLCNGDIGDTVDTMVRGRVKDSTYRWLLLTAQLVERRGHICVLYIAMMDITQIKEANESQRISEEMLRIAAETDQRAIIIYDIKHSCCRVESRTLYCANYGDVFYDVPQSLIDHAIVSQDSFDEFCALFARIQNGEQKIRVSLQMRVGDNKFEWFECNAATVFDAEGFPDHAVLVFHNITEQRVKEAVFKKWQQSIDSRPDDSYTLFRCNLTRDASLDEQDGSLLKISFTQDITSFNEKTRLYVQEFVYPDDRDEYSKLLDSDSLLAMFYRGEHYSVLDYREIVENGEPVWRRVTIETVEYPYSSDVQAFLMYEDIDAAKKTEIAERELAETDPLTGAYNRGAFIEKVNDIIIENPQSNCALIMLDMDGFKRLNDTFGHAAGDQALQEVTAVLRSFTRGSDLVCRLGGDEFLVFLRDIPYDAVIGRTAQQICEHIRKAYSQEVLLSASAGIAVYPRDGQCYDELYPKADKALYKVKNSDKGTYAFYSEIGEIQTAEIAEAVSEVRQASGAPRTLKRRMLVVDDSDTNRTLLKGIFKDEYNVETARNGAEAMIRLRHFGISISVVLLDLLMPGVDGFDVLRRMRNDYDMRTIPVIVVTGDDEREEILKAFELGASEYVSKPVDVDIIRMRVRSVISKAENERLRAQNSYLMLQRDEEVKYRTVLESTGTMVIEYDWRNHVYIYDNDISKYIAGNYDHRGLWQVFLSDMIADSIDVKTLQDAVMELANDRERKRVSKLVRLKTPSGVRHWFRSSIYKNVDSFGLTEKMIITFNDVHEEVQANDRLLFQATRDALTGLYNRAGFLEKAAELIAGHEAGYYVMSCIDVDKFQIINDQYGIEVGDEVLRYIASTVDDLMREYNGISCRYVADKFAVLYPAELLNSGKLEEIYETAVRPRCVRHPLRLRIGRWLVSDTALPVSAMLDRAIMAETLAKGSYDTYIVDYDESMRDKILKEQQIVVDMVDALKNGEFEPWFQPQYNHATGALIGAEALVRWRKQGRIIPPNDFIPVFEKNGFIYEVDQSVWRQVCALLRRWLDEGKNPLPVSVNISRHDMFQENFVSVITGLVAEYQLPAELLRLEITESAFSAETNVITDIAGKLIDAGFTVEIDDFGSGYSSLNTLKDVPASIIKLDMRFFETTVNSSRGGSIVEAIVRMAKWLGMAIIAEGVEDKVQADYLKSIGCYYIQGYFYSKPLPVADYENIMCGGLVEHRLSRLETLESLDSDLFWDPKSMETLIFNSYVGGACIFEHHNGKVEILRYNDQYISELKGLIPPNADIKDVSIAPFLDAEGERELEATLRKAVESGREASNEMRLTKGDRTEYVRQTARVIAKTVDRTLYYGVIQNLTEQHRLEQERAESADRLSIIMKNVNGGVSAIEINTDDGTSHIIFHNDKYYELYGYTRADEDKQEIDPLSFIIPEDFPGVMEKIRQLKEDGQPTVIDYGIVKKDGSHAQLRINASIMTMAGYGPIITSVLMDVTKQRTLEDQLRAIVDNINAGVTATYLQNNKLRYILSSDKFYEIIGYTREQYAEEIKSVFDIIHPGDRERMRRLFDEALKADKPYTLEYRVIRRNGTVRYVIHSASIMHMFGVVEPVQLSVFNDVTLLRESQIKEQGLTKQIQTIMKNINGGISAAAIHDNSRAQILFANDGYYELLGYTRAQFEAENVDALELVLPEDRESTLSAIGRTMREHGSETFEYRCRKRDGSVIWVQSSVSAVSIPGADDAALISITTDITALRRAEEQSREMSDRLSAVLNAMTNGIAAVVCKEHIQFLFANDRYYKIHGLGHGCVAQDAIRTIFESIHPDDREHIRRIITGTNKAGQSAEAEYRMIMPGGKTRHIKITISVINLIGIDAPVQVSRYSDITEEKKASEQIRFLNESASEILAQPDSEIAINDTLRKLLDYFAGERAYIFELDDAAQTSDNTYEICAPGIEPEMQRLKSVPYDTQKYWFDTFSKQGFIAISDVASLDERENEMRELLLAQNIRSIIVAPLWRDSRLIGYVGVDNPAAAVDEVSRLIALSDYIAILLTRRDLNNSVERERQTARLLMNDTPGGFVRMELFPNKNPGIVAVNEGLCKMLDMTRDEVFAAYGDDAYACLADGDAALAPEVLAQAYASGGEYTSTCQLRRKNGEFVWVMLFGRILSGEAGRLFLNTYFTDITEQRSVEQLQSELLENLPSGAALYEFDGENLRAIHINKHYWELVGRSPSDISRKSLPEVFHPDDRIPIFDELKSAIRQGRNATLVARIICGDGEYRPFSIVTNNVREKNGNYLLYATFTLITDEEIAVQKMLPVALSTIVANTDDMSYIKDKNLRYICVSQSVAEMAGAKSPRDLIGKTAGEAFDPVFAEKFDNDDRVILETGKPVVRALEHIPTKTGSVCLARTTKFPILDATGSAIGIYSVSHDITAQKEKESQLELLTDTIPGGLAAYSISGEGIKTLYFNDGFFDYSGYTREEYIALTKKEPLALMLAEDRPEALNMVRGFIAQKQDGMTGTCSYRCRTKGGEIRWMSMKAVLTQVSEDAYVLNAVQLDITERINAEKRQTELLENLPFGAALYEYDGHAITALHINKRYFQLVNREIDYSQGDFNPLDGIHPDDHRLVFDEIRTANREGRNGMCDIRLLYGKDEYRPFHLDASIVPSGDGKYILYVAYAPVSDKEQELKTTSARLKLLSDSIPGGIATFRCTTGNIEPVYFNDGICSLTGYSREEFDNSSITVLGMILDEDRPIITKQITLLRGGATALDYVMRITTKSGAVKWVQCVANVTGMEGKDIFLISAVITDVTGQQLERERLRVSEELNRLAIDQSGKIISQYDVAKRTLTLPYTLPEIYNVPRLLENMPEEQISLGRISPETADAYRGVFRRIDNGDASGEAVYQQNSTLGWRWLKSQFTTVFDSNGKPVSAVVTFEDITEQRDKEAIYLRWQNAIAERPKDSYTIVRCNLNQLKVVDSWEGNLLPFRFVDSAQSFNARTLEFAENYVHTDDRAIFIAFLNSDTMLAEYYRGHRSDAIDFRELSKDGSERWLRLTVDLVEYKDSTDVEAYMLFEDIDEQKLTELSTIRRAETDPLTGVLNRTTFAQRVNQAIIRSGKQTRHALFMMDIDGFKQVNDIFGHGAGDQVLTELANMLTRFCCKDDLVGRLGGDEFFVFLANIGSADAAVKAQQICDMSRKTLGVDVNISTSIGIALRPWDGDSFDSLYKVADSALYRAKEAGKDGYAFSTGEPVIGTGVKRHSRQPGVRNAVKQKRRVLIADDDKITLTMLEGILRKDYIIEKAMDGASALAMLRHYGTAVSVVLLDLMMPGMNGFEVLDKLQHDERTCTIPVIVVSADEDRDTALKVIRAGASDLITKPVDSELLRIRLESAISKSENERLRAQNSYLAIRNTEVHSYRAALERTGTMVVMLDWGSQEFSYSPSMSKKLAGRYDERPFWSILAEDEITDKQTAKRIEALAQAIAEDNERTEDSLNVRLKTVSGLSFIFELNIFKELDDYGLAPRMIMTLKELVPEQRRA